MTARAAWPVWVALAAGLLAFGAWAATGAATGETLTLEDVVRLHVSGVGADELIARIRAAQVDFDLEEAMLQELRLAGLGEPVIQAMIERQLELHPPPPAVTVEPAAPAPPGLEVRLRVGEPGGGSRPAAALRVADAVPPEILKRLGIDDERARIGDVAVYVACVSPTHVPDHWRMQSPLGRDFEATPRHRMLAFVSGATREGAADRGMLSLSVPESLAVELDLAETHEIVIGVAIQLAGRYYTASLSSQVELAPADTAREIEAWIVPHGPDARSIEVLLPS